MDSLTIADVVGPSLAALVGAWAGAALALHRFKRERAYEHRVDWYRYTLRAVNETQKGFALVATYTREGKHERAGRELEKAEEAMWEALKHTHEAKLYGTKSTVSALKEMDDEVRGMDFERLSAPAAEDVAKRADRLSELFKRTSNIVAAEGRKVMKAKRLNL